METLGTIFLQCLDRQDIFHVVEVVEDGVNLTDEALLELAPVQFDSDKAWVTGHVPQMASVSVEGDTSVILGWFKAKRFSDEFQIRIYIECEEAEELVSATMDIDVSQTEVIQREEVRTELIGT